MNFIISEKRHLSSSDYHKSHAINLLKMSYLTTNLEQKKIFLESAMLLNSSNETILYELGIFYLFGMRNDKIGFYFLEKSFDEKFVSEPIQIKDDKNKFFIGLITARYLINDKQYENAKKLLNLVSKSEISKIDRTADIMLATMLKQYPLHVFDCQEETNNYIKNINNLLNEPELCIECAYKDTDPHLFCMLSPFIVESYYEFDFREAMQKYVELTVKLFPNLVYTYSPNDFAIKEKTKKKNIAIISSFFFDNSSVICDFKGILSKLSRQKYNITYIYIKTLNNYSSFIHKAEDNVIEIQDFHDKWLCETRKEIENLNLDLLFYLEPIMSHHIQKLMLSKLAPIQIVSHGHPVTSGISSSIINFYISWGAAELDYNISKKYYTEELYLLPKDSIHQYYEPRTHNGISLINNMRFDNIKRSDFSELAQFQNQNWYLCMQKPFKCHPEMLSIIQDILICDENSVIILHKSEKYNLNTLEINFQNHKRVVFLPEQPHHLLLALYSLSDVVLDSYYIGGCTTTREALELGIPVITLPSKYLGSRWSIGLYSIIGIYDCIATSKEVYVALACKFAVNKDLNKGLRDKIKKNIHKIFYQNSAVSNWEAAFDKFLNITPTGLCQLCDNEK